ncbi:hypothetical protein VTL71DRAFT_13778 [Oculimacula yallundae]|uniref:BZIP domain-containing protein n=1 Tax=Oculimacula yallundae TaxID=86028 RepID=A0ABR4CLY8_9HELO
MSTSSEKANLARIRDNQRRSRARRKEYLQELETRLRQCELLGVEASSEIQTAARRVAEENRQLRTLLLQHGVKDEGIEIYLQGPLAGDVVSAGQHGSRGEAAQVLEHLLSTRKPCCPDGNESSTVVGGEPYDKDDCSSITTSYSVWEPFQDSSGQRRPAIPQTGRAPTMQFITPSGSTTSSSNLEPTTGNGTPHQRCMPAQASNLSPGSSVTSQNHRIFDYDQQFMLPNQSYTGLPKDRYSNIQQASMYVPTTTSPNVNNCNYAADMITTMTGISDHSAVRAELGCGPGMDCEVDNQLVFNVMDRYSGVGL